MSEGWGNNQQQQIPYAARSYNNSNFSRGPRRNDGGLGGAGRPAYQNGSGFNGQRQNGGGYGQRQNGGGYGQSYDNRSFGQNRPPRNNFGGPPRTGGGGFQAVGDASSVFEIDSNKVGMVIGRKGGKIREIQENFQVHVKIDRDPGQNGLTGVTIRGEEPAIEQAKCFIQDLIAGFSVKITDNSVFQMGAWGVTKSQLLSLINPVH